MFRRSLYCADSPAFAALLLISTAFLASAPRAGYGYTLLSSSMQDTVGRQAADTFSLTPLRDNTLYEDPEGDASNGAGSAMFAGRNSASTYSFRRALLAFDVAAAIPAGSTIESVTLTLFNDAANTSPQMVSLHRLDQSWGEGVSMAGGGQGSGAPAAPGDATWTHRFFSTDLWTVSGGDFAPIASSTAVVSGPGFYTWPSTAALVADVQSFLDNPSGNFGWLLLGNESEAGSAKRFATREALDPSARPMLTIEFTPVPEPSSGCLLVVLALARFAPTTASAYFQEYHTMSPQLPQPCSPPPLRILIALGLAVLAPLATAHADTLNLGAAADNTMYNEDGNQSNGAGNSFFAGRTDGGELRRALIRFDLGAIPANSTVNSVTLTLYCSRERSGTENISLHRLTASWGEGTSHAPGEEGSGAAATTGDATWTYRFYNLTTWATPGGVFISTASATTAVGNQNNYFTWSSSGMAADVQGWVNSSSTNYGWIVIGNETTNKTTKRFESRQSTTPSYRPVLAVNYTPPSPPTGACCFTAAPCQVLTETDCTTQGGTYQGNDTTCTPDPCAQPTGACCFTDGSCLELTSTQCSVQVGTYQGNGTTCTPNPCPQPTGACCLNSGICQVLTQAQCTAQSGTYQGDNTPCTADLCPIILTPYVDALPIPPLATPTTGTPGGEATYDMEIVQVQQQLHSQLPATTLWTYEGMYPAPTILATRDVPVTVNWINDLRDEMGVLRTTHYLPVDLCVHGAENTPKVVTHLHGGHVPMAADGYPYDTYLPGQSVTYVYPNNQLPALIWYHDHALGITRLNVYMGMAGGYVITDAFEQALNLPAGEYDVPLIIQDRSFHADGSLKYPAVLQDHFFGDKMLVNGKVWPYLNVKQGKYRLRALNGCNSRTLTLAFSNGQSFQQIGTDGGLLAAPVTLSVVTLGSAERADLIVDFAPLAAGTEILLTNSAPAPFPTGDPMHDLPNVMKFVVTAQPGDTDPVPAALRPLETLNPLDAALTRDFNLRKMPEACAGSMWMINDLPYDTITEYPILGTTEIWRFINHSGVSHPMHMHLVMFQVLDRQDFDVIDGQVVPVGNPIPAAPNEMGWKDTVMCPPEQITRVITRFENYTGKYSYHCHILEHEEHEMMRQFEATCVKGDTNQDTLVDGQDMQLFVDALLGGAAEGTAAYCATDMNNNAVLEVGFDIPLFVDCLLQEVCP